MLPDLIVNSRDEPPVGLKRGLRKLLEVYEACLDAYPTSALHSLAAALLGIGQT